MRLTDAADMIRTGLFSILLIISADSFAIPKNLGQAIDTLDRCVDNYELWQCARQAKIDSMVRLVDCVSVMDAYGLYEAIGRSYIRFNADSSSYYYRKGLDLATARSDTGRMRRFSMLLFAGAASGGDIDKILADFDTIPFDRLDTENKMLYHEVRCKLYSNAVARGSYRSYKTAYSLMVKSSLDSLIGMLPEKSVKRGYYKAQRYFLDGEDAMAVAELAGLLERSAMDDDLFARIAGMTAYYYDRLPDDDGDRLYYRVLSSIGDVLSGSREPAPLRETAMELYERGDIGRAYRYVSVALDNSMKSGRGEYIADCARAYSIISDALNDESRSNMMKLAVALTAVIVIAVLIAFYAISLYRYKLKAKSDKKRSACDVEIRDAYAKRLLDLCLTYIEGFEEFIRVTRRKIKANQLSDLYDMIDSGEAVQDRLSKFHEVFDDAFFSLYPDFIEQVNVLLEPGKRISPHIPRRMTPGLRILAFMKLGVDDASKMSKFLGLSVNTIYTYRNNMRNRAADRDRFEENIKKYR